MLQKLRGVQKTAEVISDLIVNKVADKNTKQKKNFSKI